MFVTGIIRLFQSNCPRRVQNRKSLEVAMLDNKSEARVFRHRFGKITQNIFNPWFFILALIRRNFALFIFTLVLFINQINFLSPSRSVQVEALGFKWVTYSFVSSFRASKNPKGVLNKTTTLLYKNSTNSLLCFVREICFFQVYYRVSLYDNNFRLFSLGTRMYF